MVLVHDLRYLGAREATTRNFLLLSFFVLACGAALITVIAARFAWMDWTEGLRKALSGDAKGAFQPLMRDVRALAERLAQERERVAGVVEPGPPARDAAPVPAGRAHRDPRQPRAVHAREDERRRSR